MSEQNKIELPELPDESEILADAGGWNTTAFGYTADQMREYARAAVELASQSPAPIPEQVAQASGIEGLTRYEPCVGGETPSETCAYMDESIEGEYFLAADVERLLATQSAKQGAQPDTLRKSVKAIAQLIRDGEWADLFDMDEDAAALWDEVDGLLRRTAQASVEQATGAKEGAPAEQKEIECWSRDEEDFNARSLSELLDSHDDLKAGDTVWVGEADHPEPEQLISADTIIEQIGEQAYDIGGEYAEDYPDVTDEQAKELEGLVADWIRRTCSPTFYTVKNIKPYVLSHEDFPHDCTPVHVEIERIDRASTAGADGKGADHA